MRALRIVLLIGLVGTLVAAQGADEYEEYDEEPAPAPVAPRKPAPALRPRAIPIQSSRNNKIPQTPVKNTKAKAPEPEVPPQEEEVPEGEEEAEEASPGSQEPSTEAPKKTVKPTVRPFRSNEDLLSALKRRRQQAQEKGTVVDRTTQSPLHSTESTVNKSRPAANLKQSTQNKNRTRPPSATVPPQDAAPKRSPPPPPRKSSPRLSRPAPSQQPEEELQSSQESATRSKFTRGSRRLGN